MLSRLGNVVHWMFSGISIVALALVVLVTVNGSSDTIVWQVLWGAVALISWALGRGILYILNGPGKRFSDIFLPVAYFAVGLFAAIVPLTEGAIDPLSHNEEKAPELLAALRAAAEAEARYRALKAQGCSDPIAETPKSIEPIPPIYRLAPQEGP